MLQYALEGDLKRWQEGNRGIRFGAGKEGCLTNLRVADDVLLFSTSLSKLRDMLQNFKRSTEKVGLEIHPDKTKILSNQNTRRQKEVTVDNIKVEVPQKKSESAKYLGQEITFEQQETEEIKNRIRTAWAAFHKYRQELKSRSYRLCHMMRLVNMVITPMLTYASGTWTLSKEHERLIRSAQRKMLRLIIQSKRKYKDKKGRKQNIDEEPKKTKTTRKGKEEQQMKQKKCQRQVTFPSRKISTKKSTKWKFKKNLD